MSAEQEMLNDFFNYCKQIPQSDKHCYNSRARKYPDLSFTGTINKVTYIFSLEAKKDNKFNTWNYAKQLMTEILMNKKNLSNLNKYDLNANTQNALIKKLGIFLSYTNKVTDDIHDYLIDYIDTNDWDSFGSKFNIDYVFLYDDIKHELYYTSWNGFLNNKSVTANLY